MWHLVKLASSVLMLWFLIACQGDPSSSSYVNGKPLQKDLAGWYEMDTEGLKVMEQRGVRYSAAPRLELRGDGTFSESSLTGTTDGVPFLTPSATGSWTLAQHQDWWGVDFRGDVATSQFNKFGAGFYHLIGPKPPFSLRMNLGDPDSGIGISFRHM
jgi:hypothetical protein